MTNKLPQRSLARKEKLVTYSDGLDEKKWDPDGSEDVEMEKVLFWHFDGSNQLVR